MATKTKKKPASKPKRKPRPPRPVQQHIPGMEPVKNERVHKCAIAYEHVRDARCELSKEEKDAHATLLGVMEEEGVTSYAYGDMLVTIGDKKKVKVQRIKEEAAAESNGESEE